MLENSSHSSEPPASVSVSPIALSSLASPMPTSSVADSIKTSTLSALQQAQASCEAGDWSATMAACESAIAACESAIAQQVSIKNLFNTAEALQQQGNISEAVRAYLKILQQQPRTYRVYTRLRYNLMRYDIDEGDPILQEIVEGCQAIVDSTPGFQAAQVTLGYGLTKLGKTQAATECYRQASRLVTQRRSALTDNNNSAHESAAAALLSNPAAKLAVESAPDLENSRCSPDFVVIGAEKCGTTSLFQYLSQHPEILSPIEKEIDFFDEEYKHGLNWYLAHFPALPVHAPTQPGALALHQVIGETSANCLYHNLAPARIFECFPKIQLVVLLRHPVDRTISRYNMMVRNGSETRTFEASIDHELRQIEKASTPDGIAWAVLNRCRHIGNSLYYYHLQRWLSYFPLKQLLVLPSEALFADPAQTLSELCRTLKIDSPPPNQTYAKYNAGDYSAVSPAVRHRLNAFYQPYVGKLEALLSQSFAWELSA